jgi:hypothetical protein
MTRDYRALERWELTLALVATDRNRARARLITAAGLCVLFAVSIQA